MGRWSANCRSAISNRRVRILSNGGDVFPPFFYFGCCQVPEYDRTAGGNGGIFQKSRAVCRTSTCGHVVDFYKNTTYTQDYMKIILTDEDDVPEAMGRLRSVYTNLMDLKYDNKRTQMNNIINADENVQKKTQIELFRDFFHDQNNSEMSEEQEAFVSEAIKKVWREEL